MRTNISTTETDRRRQAQAEFMKLIESVSSAGFYGTASVTVNVQDGHIQTTRVAVERMVR